MDPWSPSLALGGVSGTAHPMNRAAFYLSGISSSWIYSWLLLYILSFLYQLAAAASELCRADDLVPSRPFQVPLSEAGTHLSVCPFTHDRIPSTNPAAIIDLTAPQVRELVLWGVLRYTREKLAG
jgi:hypothetical protein